MTVRMDDQIYEWLRAYSFQTRIPMSRIVSAAVLAYLELMGVDTRPHVLTSGDA